MTDSEGVDRRRFMVMLTAGAMGVPHLIRAEASPSRRWMTVQKLLDGYVADKTVAGAAVAVSYGGLSLAYSSAGKLAFDSAVPFDENSVCRIYSFTKSVTGIAAMLLVEDRKIALDQPVAEVLPEFHSLRVAIDIEKGLESRPAVKTMTMRHLLTHTSGFASWIPNVSGGGVLQKVYRERGITPAKFGERLTGAEFGPQAKNLTDMVERLAELPLAHEPGTTYLYSIGTDVMALVIERASGKNYDVFLRERLFEPLDMRSTGFQVKSKDAARLTTNYDVTPDGLKPVDPAATSVFLQPPTLLAGGGGLVSTARDFARFTAMLLGNGAFDHTRVMKSETAILAHSNLLPPEVRIKVGRGLLDSLGGIGAGIRVVLPGGDRPGAPSGTFSGSGSSGVLWWVDPSRRGNVVFMVQTMGYTPANLPYPDGLAAAIEQDLKSGNAIK